jgi:hypothetical protein
MGDAAEDHSLRFRKVSNRYPRRVAEAYGGDIVRAARDSDEQVAATVAEWERSQGMIPRDWRAIGSGEREECQTMSYSYLTDSELLRVAGRATASWCASWRCGLSG